MRKKYTYSKEVAAAWYVLKEFIDPINCSSKYEKVETTNKCQKEKIITVAQQNLNDVLRHHYSGTKCFPIFNYSKRNLKRHLDNIETHYYRCQWSARHIVGYGQSEKQAKSLSFSKDLNIPPKRKVCGSYYVLLIGIDIDCHHNEPDVAELTDWIKTNCFPESYWEQSTHAKGMHGYMKMAYPDNFDIDYVKSVIEEVFDLIRLKAKKKYKAEIDVPCGLPLSVKYDNSVPVPSNLPKISVKEFNKYRQYNNMLKKGKTVPEFISAEHTYKSIDKLLKLKLPAQIIQSQCIKIPRFNRTDKSKTNMEDIIFFHKLKYATLSGFIEERNNLRKELGIQHQTDWEEEGGGDDAAIVSSPKGNIKETNVINLNDFDEVYMGGEDELVAIVSSPKEPYKKYIKKSYQTHIAEIRNIPDKLIKTNKFYFYYSNYLGYVPDVSAAIDEYIKQRLNTNPDCQSKNRIRRFQKTKEWLDSKWDLKKRGLNLDDWDNLKGEMMTVVSSKLANVKKEYTKDAKRKQIYPIPIEELTYIYYVIWKSNTLDASRKATNQYAFSLQQVRQHLLAQYGIKCHKTKAVAILKILKDGDLINYVGSFIKGSHGNKYKATEWEKLKGK